MSYQQDIFRLISSFTGHNANYVIPKEFMRLLKDSNAALILSQLVYWTGKQTDEEGWIYKSYNDWQEEIFLSQKVVMNAVKKLKNLDIVETQVRKIRLPNGMLTNQTCVHYLVKQENLIKLLSNHLESLGNAEREFPGTTDKEFPKNAEREFPSINTKITNKYYDDIQGEPSSSFSESQLITILAGLMALIPEQHRKPSIEKAVEKGLNTHTEVYVKNAILYTIAYSNGDSWQKFKAYLGKCIDNGWADGWEPDLDQGYHIDIAAVKEQFRRMKTENLKFLADAGNQFAVAELKRR